MNDYMIREALAAHFLRLANEARAEFEEFGGDAGIIADTFFDAAADVKNFPAADVAPVVRCKDCKFFHRLGDVCRLSSGLLDPKPDSYCSLRDQRETAPEVQ